MKNTEGVSLLTLCNVNVFVEVYTIKKVLFHFLPRNNFNSFPQSFTRKFLFFPRYS